MPQLLRAKVGVLFFDDFNDTHLQERWVATPSLSSRFSLTERPGYLRVKHSDTPTYIVTDMPQSNRMMIELKNDYKPIIPSDTGGLVVFKTLLDRVELVEYYDEDIDASRSYLYMRLVRRDDMFDGYGSQDGTSWELIGSTRIKDAAKIGICLSGLPDVSSKNLDVDYIAMYSDRFSYVGNLEPNMTVQLYDTNDNIKDEQIVGADSSVAVFDMFSYPLPFEGYYKLYSPSGVILGQTPLQTLNPGDEFQYIMNINVKFQRMITVVEEDPITGHGVPVTSFISDVPFVLDSIVNIGNIDGPDIEGKVIIENLDNAAIVNLKASIGRYANDYSTHSVQLSPDNNGAPGVYQDSVIISIPAHSSSFFWIKIIPSELNTITRFDNFKYKLILSNT